MWKLKTWKVSGGLVFVYIWPSFDFRSLGLGTRDVSDVSEGVTSKYFFVPFSALFGGLFLPFSCEGQTYVVLKPRTSSWSVFCFWPHMGKWYHSVFLCVLFGKDSYEKGGEGIKLLKSALLRISSPAQCDYQTLLISFYGATKVSPYYQKKVAVW